MPQDPELYDRRAVVTVDTLEIPCGTGGLDVTFDVTKDLTGKPNTADLRVYNLSADHRAELLTRAAKKTKDGKPLGVRVRIDAGYKALGISRIFEGDLRWLTHTREGVDWVTHLETGDGEYWISRAKIYKSWAPGTPVATVLKDVAQAIGAGDGNLLRALQGSALLGAGSTFVGGTATSGPAMKELTRLTKSAGLEWSIQDGALQVLGAGKGLDRDAILLDEAHGMVGSPSVDHKGLVSVKALLIPDLFPGRKVKLNAASLKGFYRIEKVKFSGSTFGQDWYADLDCRQVA